RGSGLVEWEARPDLESEQTSSECLGEFGQTRAVGSDVDVRDLDTSFRRRWVTGGRRETATVGHGAPCGRGTTPGRGYGGRGTPPGCVYGGVDTASVGGRVSYPGRPVGVVIVDDEMCAVAAHALRATRARGRDDDRFSRDRELRHEAAGDASAAVHQHPAAGRG